MWWWLFAGAVLVAAGSPTPIIVAKRRMLVRAKKIKPKRAEPDEEPPSEPGLKVFGDSVDDDATWLPVYVADRGCHDFRWGFCLEQFLDEMEKYATVKGEKGANLAIAIARTKDFLFKLVASLYPGAAKITDWILRNLCLRFKFPLHVIEDQWGNAGWSIVEKSGLALANAAPPHPFQPREGWDRAWFTFGDNVMRSDHVVTILWSREDGGGIPVIRELATTSELRGALRMDPAYGTLPSPVPEYLASSSISCGKVTWWFARAKKASPEFR